MRKHILAVCDLEERYVGRFLEYLEETKEFPFETRVYTDIDTLKECCRNTEVDIILISESAYSPQLKECVGSGRIIILNESGKAVDEELFHVDKFQAANNLLREVMCYYAEKNLEFQMGTSISINTKVIGIYSPVKRCLQTSFALTLGQMLGKKQKVLYFNLETYSGFGRLLETEFKMDLTDLLYYSKNAKEKILLRLESIVEHVNGLDIIPPVFSLMDLNRVTFEEWKELLEAVCQSGSYNYIILDLSDSIQGLFDILRMCERVYTITPNDGTAQAKICQYETLLKLAQYTDILDKTVRYQFPRFRQIPVRVEQLPFSELGEYVRKIIMEEYGGQLSGS